MDYEYNLLTQRNVLLYKLPAISNTKGYYLDSWGEAFWEGFIKVVSKNEKCIIKLLNKDQTLFAQCQVGEDKNKLIIKSQDSSRAYAIKIEDPTGTKFTWVGLAFRDRNDAFDFTVCFEDFEKHKDMDKNPQKYEEELKPTKDYSLRQGEKITLNLPGAEKSKKSVGGGSTGLSNPFKLAPPPGFISNVQVSPQQQQQQQSSVNNQQNSIPSFSGGINDFYEGNTNQNTNSNNKTGQIDNGNDLLDLL